MEAVAFGYKCQECGRGTVEERVVPAYHTKIKGYPFIVRGARLGVCDSCGAEHFAALETERWERLFEEEHGRHFLSPEEIQELRRSLGITMEQLAFLIGCTRQSLYNWERPDRARPQSRMADLLMKLARECHQKGEVDVLRFLIQDVERFGIRLQLPAPPVSPAREPLVRPVRKLPGASFQAGRPRVAPMAADTSSQE